MRSTQQRLIEGGLLLCLCQASLAFQTRIPPIQQTRQQFQLKAIIDPNEIASAASQISHPDVSAILSTALSSTLQPAHGHSNPLFGAADPFLAAGHSIAPSAKALADMGVTQAKTASQIVPDASASFQTSVAAAMDHGWKVLNDANIKETGVLHLPGFSDTQGIFGARKGAPDSPESFAAEVKWASGYFNVMDKLPLAAFMYALTEFFILRPNVDMYKEEIEDDPTGALADTIAVSTVRVLAIAVISILLVTVFG